MVIRIVFLVVVVICGLGLYLAVDTAQALPLRQAQETALNRFGADLLNLCKSATKTRSSSLPANIKIGVIDSNTNSVYEIYDTALPGNLKATDKSDVTALLCLSEEKTAFDTDKYGTPPKYTCTRYTRDITAYLIDVKTGKTLNYRSFDGQEPPVCPDKTDTSLTRTGDIPLASEITTWLTRSVKGNL
jgi:hypothetical protein